MPMFGGDSTKTSDEEHQDHSDAVIDPALRKRGQDHHQDHQPSMPTRVEPSFQMSSPRRQHHHFDTPNTTRGPSPPPPIATIPNSHSPSPSVVSVDRSSNSTPHIRRSPPESMQPVMYSSSYHDPRQQHHPQQHPYAPREPINHHPHPHQYMYTPHHPPPFDPQPRYDHPQHPHDSYSAPPGGHFAVPAMSHPPPQMHAYGRQYPLPGQAPVTIVHTDDAATKLTDGIRRRCFNCCTTDTSTWRRSNLSPGKVLCNKCGLFERTHSRPRPDQFPHKRGPLASSVMRGRTPPGSLSTSLSTSSSTQLPPISATAPGPYTTYHHMGPGEYPHPSQGQQGPGQQQQQQGLPGLQSWSTGNTSTGSGSAANGVANGSASSTPTGAGATTTTTTSGPGQRAPQESPRLPNNSSASASASSRGGKYDYEELSSNAADRSHPPSPPSRSSTAAGTKATAVVNGSADGADSKPISREA